MLTDLVVYKADGASIALGDILHDRTLLIALRHLA
jgi:hypothetical protein